jgi:hypothetical protein
MVVSLVSLAFRKYASILHLLFKDRKEKIQMLFLAIEVLQRRLVTSICLMPALERVLVLTWLAAPTQTVTPISMK